MKFNYQGKINTGESIADGYITSTGCTILVSIDDGKYHLSIAHKSRYPTKKEIDQARKKLLPKDKTFDLISSIGYNDNCFHLWEVEKEELH
ncbi:hypothetical protein U472_00285 [Orenia metallireducens]|uniref:Uncharacterized protein n=1 Tax=Orenia metallireducens TaxID=1413210 RepID=A0A1C0ADC2_9FIRM|nr:hypothetical protein [Orenia metallireducens]OCL28629.1 hypothetical protein U472_00285 [Orenia metallireducens]